MPRRKFEPENWDYDIEQWERKINDPWFLCKEMMKKIRKEEDEAEQKQRLLNMEKEDYCPHKRKGHFEHQYMCLDCGLVLDNNYSTNKHNVGYYFRNHVMRPQGKKKKR